ncbi:MAG: helix-turn-helix domain-containing protein [Burkholderiales bacterium]|nr:helix-turn-helix domain-containing protein [Burkholderiales bacterium]
MTTITAFKPLSKDDLADVLGVSIRTIENWVNEGILPAPTKLGNRVYWHPNAFYAWLDRRLSAETANSAPAQDGAPEPSPSCARPKKRSASATAKTELEKVRSRTQAQLDALMA